MFDMLVYVGKRVRRVGVTGSWWLVLVRAREHQHLH